MAPYNGIDKASFTVSFKGGDLPGKVNISEAEVVDAELNCNFFSSKFIMLCIFLFIYLFFNKLEKQNKTNKQKEKKKTLFTQIYFSFMKMFKIFIHLKKWPIWFNIRLKHDPWNGIDKASYPVFILGGDLPQPEKASILEIEMISIKLIC